MPSPSESAFANSIGRHEAEAKTLLHDSSLPRLRTTGQSNDGTAMAQDHNPLYAASDINDTWREDAPTDDGELWTALTTADTESANTTANDEPQPCTSPDFDIDDDDTWLEDALRDHLELWTALCATDTESTNTTTDHQPQPPNVHHQMPLQTKVQVPPRVHVNFMYMWS